MNVQHWLDDAAGEKAGSAYKSVDCPACTMVHFVHRKSGKLLGERLHDWMYFSEPERELAGRKVECARGKVVGGSSAVNAMFYVRGHRADYDRWADSGLRGWDG